MCVCVCLPGFTGLWHHPRGELWNGHGCRSRQGCWEQHKHCQVGQSWAQSSFILEEKCSLSNQWKNIIKTWKRGNDPQIDPVYMINHTVGAVVLLMYFTVQLNKFILIRFCLMFLYLCRQVSFLPFTNHLDTLPQPELMLFTLLLKQTFIISISLRRHTHRLGPTCLLTHSSWMLLFTQQMIAWVLGGYTFLKSTNI